MSKKINYAFSEDKALRDLQTYVDGTYGEHYAKRKYQSTQFIDDCGHGEGFCMGNILKYAQRYGRKNGHNRCLLYTSPSPRDGLLSRMPSSA